MSTGKYERMSAPGFLRMAGSGLKRLTAHLLRDVMNVRQTTPTAVELYDKAIASCLDKIRVNPDDSDGYYGLGLLYYKKGDHRQAERYYNKAIRLNPYDADLYYSLGLLCGKRNECSMAVRCFEKVIQLKPADAEACYRLGAMYARLGNIPEARRCAIRLKELRRNDLASILEEVA